MANGPCCQPALCSCANAIHLAPCPPPTLGYNVFVAVARQQNLTEDEIDQLVVMCKIQQPEPPIFIVEESKPAPNSTAIIVGVVLGFVLAVALVLLVIVLCRLKQKHGGNQKRYRVSYAGSVSGEQNVAFEYDETGKQNIQCMKESTDGNGKECTQQDASNTCLSSDHDGEKAGK